MTDSARGRLTLDELRDLVGRGLIETVIVGFTDHYGRLLGKRHDAEMFVDDTAAHGTHGCNYLLTTDMEMQPVPGYSLANWQQGYGDFHLVPDLSTLVVAAWPIARDGRKLQPGTAIYTAEGALVAFARALWILT